MASSSDSASTAKVRIDKWLWAARFYKTRSLASEAVSAGHVQLEGERVKPAKGVNVGQRVSVKKGRFLMELNILALSEKRGSATLAQTLYQETEQSAAARADAKDSNQLERKISQGMAGDGRPDKRQRRQRVAAKSQLGSGGD